MWCCEIKGGRQTQPPTQAVITPPITMELKDTLKYIVVKAVIDGSLDTTNNLFIAPTSYGTIAVQLRFHCIITILM